MSQDLRHILDRDTFTDQICGKCPPEAVRMDIANACLLSQGFYDIFHALLAKAFIWCLGSHE